MGQPKPFPAAPSLIMKLTDLDPKLSEGNILTFDCPVCKGDNAHKIRVPLKPAPPNASGCSWDHTGSFPDTLSITPSINAGEGCWHGYITNGQLT